MGETGAAYYEQGNLEKAGMIFAEMINLDPSSAAAHAALGAVLTRIQENDQALELLNRALELNPHELAALVNRGEVWLRRGEHDLALRDLEHAMELDPEKTDPGANRARAMRYGLLRRLGKEVPL